MDQRVSLITLGVRDVAASRAFYERLGWRASGASQDGVAFFQLNGLALSLYGRDSLAHDADLPTPPAEAGPSGFSLAQNFGSTAEVDGAYADALAAGATALKPPHTIFWGGYCAFVADPDGFVWELAFNPFFDLTAAKDLVLPP